MIDLDGFNLDGTFKTKELAIGNMDTNVVDLYHFQVGNFDDLTSREKKDVTWVKNNIHGLYYRDYDGDLPESRLMEIMSSICNQAKSERRLIAHKGGSFEIDLMRKLGFGNLALNIEKLDCPPLEKLLTWYPTFNYLYYFQCGRHCPIKKRVKVPHCPRLEVRCFMDYVQLVQSGCKF